MARERWTVSDQTGGVLVEKGYRWTVIDSDSPTLGDVQIRTKEKEMADFIAGKFNAERPSVDPRGLKGAR